MKSISLNYLQKVSKQLNKNHAPTVKVGEQDERPVFVHIDEYENVKLSKDDMEIGSSHECRRAN